MLKQKKAYKRGYSVAILLGIDDDRAVLWRVFSNVVKPEKTLWLDRGRDSKATYSFFESVVNALRPALKEGVRSIILASPVRTDFAKSFIQHIHEHHMWLVQGQNKAAFSELTGSATTLSEVAALTRTLSFNQLISKTASEETENLIAMLDKYLSASSGDAVILYSFDEIEDLILPPPRPGRLNPEYLLITNKYLSKSRQKNRMNRLLQIAASRTVKTRIVDVESSAGQRLTQLGGMVCLARIEQRK